MADITDEQIQNAINNCGNKELNGNHYLSICKETGSACSYSIVNKMCPTLLKLFNKENKA